jgi:hypothetical protein
MKRRVQSEDTGVNGKEIIKWILKIWGLKMWTLFNRITIVCSGRPVGNTEMKRRVISSPDE